MGSLIGLAIGDAMGAPSEGMRKSGRRITEMEGGGPNNRIAGHYTDDTLQAVAISESLTICRGFCPEDIAKRLIAGYHTHPELYGPTSSAVFGLIEKGMSPYRAAALVHAVRGSSRSNGSVMRGPPIGVFFSGPAVNGASICCSRLTHYDPVAGACSAWLNQMVSDMARGSSRTRALDHAAGLCRNEEVSGVLGDYRRYDPVSGLDALLCTHAALKSFMESRNFEDAVVSAVSMGGDTDTVGACCGALAGSCFGLLAIPDRWLSRLHNLGYLTGCFSRLWAVSHP